MPKLTHFTDLHLDTRPANHGALVEGLREASSDLYLIGGDNGGVDGLRWTVETIRAVDPNAPIAWVMGNHDLWGRSYRVLWDDYHHIDAVHLEAANLELDYCTVVGTYGHYDYSGGDPAIPFEKYENYRHGQWIWNDHYIDRMGRSNPEIADEIAQRFEPRYTAAIARGLPVVVLMHTLPFVQLNAWPTGFFSAYSINGRIGAILLSFDRKPAVLFCGHTHRASASDAFGFPMFNTGSDYEDVRVTRWDLDDR